MEFNFPYLNNSFNAVLFESLELKPFLNIKTPKDIKISPKNFWHGYPNNDKNWILANSNGKLINSIKKIIIK